MQYKSFKLDLKEATPVEGQPANVAYFEGYASTFGNEDEDKDVVVKGAFKRTINSSGGKIVILYQHDRSRPIGVNRSMVEDSKGLAVKAEINLDVQDGKESYSLLKQGALNALSIGYKATQWSIKSGVRYITEIKLFEYSIVTFPANEQALVTSVKGGGKAMAFANHLAASEASRDRYMVEQAKDDMIDSYMTDASMKPEEKKSAIRKGLHDYADAMADVHDTILDDSGMDTDDPADDTTKGAKALGKNDLANLMKARRAHARSMNHMREAVKEARVGDKEVYSMLYRWDVNAPVEVGGKEGKEGDPEELHSLKEALQLQLK